MGGAQTHAVAPVLATPHNALHDSGQPVTTGSASAKPRWKMSRSVSAVRWRDRNTAAARHVCRRHGLPSGDRIRGQPHGDITSLDSARSYADQFPTWYFVLYFGCTLDFMSRSCTCCRHDGQEVDRGSPRARDPCTNAIAPRRHFAVARSVLDARQDLGEWSTLPC